MENIVTLSLEEYNRLRDFEKEIKSGKTLYFHSYFYDIDIRFITTDEAIEILNNENEELRRCNSELRISNATKRKKYFSEIRKISIWQFFKWKVGLLELKS